MSVLHDQRPVFVVDFGAQYAQLIARRVREARVYSEIVPCDITPEELRRRDPAALILSGGPASVYAEDAPTMDKGIYDLGIPILGLCYGMQLMAIDLGGDVCIHGSPNADADARLGCISLSPADANDLYGILSKGSAIVIRR